MTATGWLTDERTTLASDRILDAAGRLFAEHGVRGTDVVDIARAAGCSRATVYRYFENRHVLQRAFVQREAVRIARAAAADVHDIDEPGERLVTAVLSCLRAVRGDPAVAAWFGPDDLGLAAEVSASTALIDELARSFLARPGDGVAAGMSADDPPAPEARWLVRIIVSLLAMPGADEADERAMLERFVVPVVT